MLESFASAARMTLHVEATGRDDHHVAEAACKAVGRALRAARQARIRRAPEHEGTAVTRSRSPPTAPATCARSSSRSSGSAPRPSSSTSRSRCSPPTSPSCPASARPAARWPACAAAGSTRPCASAPPPGNPILGICLGLQLALDESEEDGGIAGLGLVPGRAVRLREGRIPRIGWAAVEPGGEAYWFAHSYAADSPATTATSEGIAAIVESGPFLGVQFHPEKSGAAGRRFLERYLERCLSRV